MNLTKSIRRISWRFSKGTFTPNKEDIDCLLEIAGYVERKEKQQIIDNQLFGKLYIYLIGQFMTHYDCSITSGTTQSEINKILNTPLKKLVQDLLEKENTKQLEYSIEINKDPNPVKMEYDEMADNLKAIINAALNTYGSSKAP